MSQHKKSKRFIKGESFVSQEQWIQETTTKVKQFEDAMAWPPKEQKLRSDLEDKQRLRQGNKNHQSKYVVIADSPLRHSQSRHHETTTALTSARAVPSNANPNPRPTSYNFNWTDIEKKTEHKQNQGTDANTDGATARRSKLRIWDLEVSAARVLSKEVFLVSMCS